MMFEAIIAAELGLILLGMVAIFGLELFAMVQRNKKDNMPLLRLLTPEEIKAHGLDKPEVLDAVNKSGQYL